MRPEDLAEVVDGIAALINVYAALGDFFWLLGQQAKHLRIDPTTPNAWIGFEIVRPALPQRTACGMQQAEKELRARLVAELHAAGHPLFAVVASREDKVSDVRAFAADVALGWPEVARLLSDVLRRDLGLRSSACDDVECYCMVHGRWPCPPPLG